jgi:hypothetical protein
MIVRRKRLFVILPLIVLATAVFGFLVMSLWNWLIPALFGGKLITFWQAVGVLALSRILFGGMFRRGAFGDRQRARRAIWERLTPEEREKLRAGMRPVR